MSEDEEHRETARRRRRKLEAAGWKLKEERGAIRIWETPDTGEFYEERAAFRKVQREEESG